MTTPDELEHAYTVMSDDLDNIVQAYWKISSQAGTSAGMLEITNGIIGALHLPEGDGARLTVRDLVLYIVVAVRRLSEADG